MNASLGDTAFAERESRGHSICGAAGSLGDTAFAVLGTQHLCSLGDTAFVQSRGHSLSTRGHISTCIPRHRVVAKLKDMQYGDVMPRNLSVHLRGGAALWRRAARVGPR
jgi:hypothetical protein